MSLLLKPACFSSLTISEACASLLEMQKTDLLGIISARSMQSHLKTVVYRADSWQSGQSALKFLPISVTGDRTSQNQSLILYGNLHISCNCGQRWIGLEHPANGICRRQIPPRHNRSGCRHWS